MLSSRKNIPQMKLGTLVLQLLDDEVNVSGISIAYARCMTHVKGVRTGS